MRTLIGTYAPTDTPGRDLAEEPLHLLQPARPLRREVHVRRVPAGLAAQLLAAIVKSVRGRME